MTTPSRTVSRDTLARKLAAEAPDNRDPRRGFALVNVLPKESFEREHIPGSINIPRGNEDVYEALFERDKEIVLYCASPECDASPKAAGALVRRGFRNVRDYEAGLSDWKRAGCELAGQAH